MNRYQEIEIDGKRMLSVEMLNRIRKGESALGIERANLDVMSAEELGAYLQNLRGRWKGSVAGESPPNESPNPVSETPSPEAETIQSEWAAEVVEGGQITKLVDELTEAELERIKKMGISLEAVDYVTLTKTAFCVATDGKQWQQKRLGTKPASDDEMQKLKAEYNRLLTELRAEKDAQAVWEQMEKTYEAIVCGGHTISCIEASEGFDEASEKKVASEKPKTQAASEQKKEHLVLF